MKTQPTVVSAKLAISPSIKADHRQNKIKNKNQNKLKTKRTNKKPWNKQALFKNHHASELLYFKGNCSVNCSMQRNLFPKGTVQRDCGSF